MSKEERQARTTAYAQGLADLVNEFERRLREHGSKAAEDASERIRALIAMAPDERESVLDALAMAVDAEVVQQLASGIASIVAQSYSPLLSVVVDHAVSTAREKFGRELINEALGTDNTSDDVPITVRFLQDGGDA